MAQLEILAGRINALLDGIGYPLKAGHHMASTP